MMSGLSIEHSHIRSWLTAAIADRVYDVGGAAFCIKKAIQTDLSSTVEHVANAGVYALSRDKMRLQRAQNARAVRKRSSFPWPARDRSASPRLFSLSLTPAHGDARRLRGHFSPDCGLGGMVLHRTAREPFQNHQLIEIAVFFARFSRFSRACGLHVRGRAYARARACGRLEKHRTTELNDIWYVYQYLISSQAVPRRFCVEPTYSTVPERRGNALFFNKIGAGYSVGAVPDRFNPACRGLLRGRGGEKFGVFRVGRLVAWSAGALAVDRLSATGALRAVPGRLRDRDRGGSARARLVASKNGGFLLFFHASMVRVGRTMFEVSAERRGNASFQVAGRKPIELAALGVGALAWSSWALRKALGGCRSCKAPPSPPLATRALPRSLPRQTGQILDRDSGADRPHVPPDRVCTGFGRIAQKLKLPAGPGEARHSPRAPKRRWMWQGGAGEMHQRAEISGVARHVN